MATEVKVEITIRCTCGKELDVTLDGTRYPGEVTVQPCRNCLLEAKDAGYQQGTEDSDNE